MPKKIRRAIDEIMKVAGTVTFHVQLGGEVPDRIAVKFDSEMKPDAPVIETVRAIIGDAMLCTEVSYS